MPKGQELNTKELIFCNKYIETQNATESYLAAYPDVTRESAGVLGHRLLKKVKIRAYIDKQLQDVVDDSIADARETLQIITAAARGQIKEQKPVFNPETGSIEVVETDPYLKDRVKAAELLAKRYQLLTDKVDMSADITINVDLEEE